MRQGLAATPSPFSSLPGSAEALRQPRLRETKLAQHRGLVPLLPAFGHPAVENAIEDEPPNPNRLAGRSRAGETGQCSCPRQPIVWQPSPRR